MQVAYRAVDRVSGTQGQNMTSTDGAPQFTKILTSKKRVVTVTLFMQNLDDKQNKGVTHY